MPKHTGKTESGAYTSGYQVIVDGCPNIEPRIFPLFGGKMQRNFPGAATFEPTDPALQIFFCEKYLPYSSQKRGGRSACRA